MSIEIARTVVLVFGGMIILLCLWGIYSPERPLDMVRAAMEKTGGFAAAIVVRLGLGLALILAADTSRLPLVFQVLGWIAIVAAVGLLFLGRARLQKFIAAFDRLAPGLIRLWLLLGIVFAGVLVYGAS